MSSASRMLKRAGVLAVLVVLAAVWMASQRAPQESAVSTEEAVPGLKQRLASIDKVSIRKAGDEAVATLLRRDDAWTLEQRDYPADSGALRTLMLNLIEARRVEQKTSNPELYARLGVEDVGDAEARGVELLLEGGGDPIEVTIGDNTPRGEGTYLRVGGDPASWQIDRSIAVEKSTANWLQRDLTEIEPDRVAQARVRKGSELIEVHADDTKAGDFVLRSLPKGREPASEYVADALAGFLQGLRFEDLAAAMQPPAEGTWQSEFVLADGLRIDVVSWDVEGKVWSNWAISFDEAAAKAAIQAEQSDAKARWDATQAETAKDAAAATTAASTGPDATTPAADTPASVEAAAAGAPQSDAGDAKSAEAEAPLAVRDPAAHLAERLAELTKQFAQLQARFQGRSFQLPTHKSSNLHRAMEAYLKPKE